MRLASSCRWSLLVLALLAPMLGGCGFYFGNGDDDPCAWGANKAEPAIAYLPLRNPETGQCDGGVYPCDDRCGPCPAARSLADWGACESECTYLDESACHATPGCFAAYHDVWDAPPAFWGCWQTAPSGPVGGSCANLDAQECSRHDNCIAIYSGSPDNAKFYSCAPEPTGLTCAAVDCGPGYHCEEQCHGNANDPATMTGCYPVCVPTLGCAAALCAPGTTCVETCSPGPNGTLTCTINCVSTGGDPGACYGTVVCDLVEPACPSGTTPGTRNGCYTGYCIPVAHCGPSDPGSCTGPLVCDALPPACPSGTVAGIVNGCWSGYCIPQHACPAPACETLADEAACLARSECTPVYTGTGCSCTPGTCTCQTLTWNRCQS
jgi:hypothetical protein